MASLQLFLFGSPRLERDGEQIPLGRRKAMAILALLAVSGEPQTRERLLALLWPEYDAASGRSNLRRDLSTLRRTLAGEYLIADRHQVRLDGPAGLSVDVARFRALLAQAQLGEGAEEQRGIALLTEAVSHYSGELMAGFSLPDAPEFDEWLFFERESLRRALAAALQQLVAHHGAQGEYETGIGFGRRWLGLDPLHEAAHRELMKLYAWSGQQGAALRQYEECARILEEELGVVPEEETAALVESIRLRQLEAPVIDEKPERERATSRSAPGRASSAAQALAAAAARPSATHNLPVQATPFVGREEELARLEALLTQPEVRLVTITGPGGIGKTRLSLAAAERARRFPDGVTFVPLAPLESAANIVSAIAEAVDFRFFGELDPWRQLLNYLAPKRMLLVLDNFEHLLDGGAALVAELVGEAPGVKLLTTSRERLHLSGEAVYRIAGLPYPEDEATTAENLARYGAMALMLQQSRLVRPGRDPDEAELLEVARICRLVQGMPLAIVLAAGWLEMLSYKEIADEIAGNLDILESENRDMPSRQRSVRAAFAYSWDQLSQDERAVFMKLSVFRGGFSREAAGEVTGARLRTLRALVEKSLLIVCRPDRYEVHELLRQVAAEKLAESGEQDGTRTAHSTHYLRALAELEEDIKGGRQVEAFAEIDADLENVRAAWRWATEQRMQSYVNSALEVLYLHFYIRGREQDGAALLRLARRAWEDRQGSRFLARILTREFWLRTMPIRDDPQFERDLNKSLEIARAHADQFEAAFATFSLGFYHSTVRSDNVSAIPFFEASRDQFHALGDDYYLAWALVRLGYAQSGLAGRWAASREHTRLGLELARGMGNKMQVAWASMNLGAFLVMDGDYDYTAGLFDEVISVALETGFKRILPHVKIELGLLHLLHGDLAQVKAMVSNALKSAREKGDPKTQAYALAALALEAVLRGDYSRALKLGQESLVHPSNLSIEWYAHWAMAIAYCGLGRVAPAEQALFQTLRLATDFQWQGAMTWLLPVAALLDYRAGRHTRAVELLSLAMHHPRSATGWIERWTLAAEMRADLERKLAPADFKAAWERGKELDLEGTAADLLNLVQGHPAATRETREKAEALSSSGVLTPGSGGVEDSTMEAAVAQIVADEPDVAPEARHNLPVQTMPFLGREEELARLEELLTQPAVRLVTIVGLGGMGKTRLALAAAERLVGRLPDGVTFVPLAAVTEPDQIAQAVAEALGLRFYGAAPPEEQLQRQLGDQNMLLVLDNFEQLVEAADRLNRLLAAAPGVKLLVTSRERLNLAQEWTVDLPGLPYPSEGEAAGSREELLGRYEALQLFAERARQADGRFAPTVEDMPHITRISQLVGGMPLGLEMAAAWKALISCAEIAAEIGRNLDFLTSTMRDVPERHRSLRAVFDHSWSLLSSDEQAVFRKLSVFRGGFSLEAAVEVTDASLPLLAELIRKALIKRGDDGRYELHELLRQFAAEHLSEDPDEEEATLDGHAAHFAGFMHAREDGLYGRRQNKLLDEIGAEFDNVLQAWRWAALHRDPVMLRQMVESFFLFCEMGRQLAAGIVAFRRASKALREPGDDQTTNAERNVHGLLLVRLGKLLGRVRDFDEALALGQEGVEMLREAGAEAHLDLVSGLSTLGLKSYYGGLASDARKLLAESLDLARTAGDDRRTGEALSSMGHVDEFQGKFSQADVRFRASVETLEKIDEQYHRGYSLNNRGRAVYAMGDYALAERLVESALAIRRRAGDEVAIAYSLLDLGTVALMAGDYGRADENVEESLAIGRRLGLLDTEARCFNALGTLHRARRQYAEAADAHQRSLDIYRETNVPRDLPHTLNGLAAVALAQGQLEKVHEYLQESLEIAAELDNIGHRAEALNLMGNLAAAESRWQEAREHYRQALEITEETGARPLALEILVGVAALHLNGPEPNPPRAADLLNLVQGHPAATRETREKAEALSSSGVLTPGSRGVEDSSLEAAVAQIVAEEPVVAPEARHNLPVQTTPFLGREEELARLEELLTQPAVRLITIVGPGGIGKTRLSLAAAERARRFRDGVTFVPLAPLESAANIVSAIAEAVDFRFFGELDPWRQLLNYLAPKGMLLVLDNFEHLLDGGADLVAELLAEAPGVKLLTTSRERLHLTGEAVYRIAGLPYPEGELPMGRELSQYGAVALLLQQAGLMRPGEAPDEAELVDMAHICRLVQGMPLAIILAAGWLEALSFKEIAGEIAGNLDILESENRDMPSRQRSVRAAFAYSWDQLSQDERAVFMKLSVFRGGFSRRAAGEVAGARLRALRALVEKSLLVASRSERYEVHELLRQYAAEKLDESGEQEHIQTAHSIYYLRALGELEEDIKGGRQVEAIAEIDADLENVRAAWIWAVRHRMASAIDDGLEAYYLHMYIRGRHQEGAELLGIARATWETRQESRLLGRIIARQILALIRPQQGGPQFVADLNRSVAVAEAHGDAFEAALATLALGYYHSRLHSDNEAARPYFQASCEQFRRLGDDFYLAFALVRLGYAESTLGGTQGDSYLDHTRQGLELAKKMGNKMQVVSGSVNLGTDRLMQGEYELAERLSNDAFVAGTEMRFKVAQAQSRTILSLLHLVRGELDRGRELATWALAMAKEVNFPLTQGYALSALAVAASLRGEYDEALQLGEESLARPSNPQGEWPARWAQCIAHCGLAQLALARQKLATNLRVAVEYRWLGPMTWLLPVAALLEYRAGRHARAVELLSLAMHHPLSATGWMAHWAPAAEMRAGLAGKLDAADYATAWERGKGLELEGTAAALLAESSG